MGSASAPVRRPADRRYRPPAGRETPATEGRRGRPRARWPTSGNTEALMKAAHSAPKAVASWSTWYCIQNRSSALNTSRWSMDSCSKRPDGAKGAMKSTARRPTVGRHIRRTSSSVSKPIGGQLGKRVDQGAEQRSVAELAVLVEGHGQHHEAAAGTQLATAECDEFMPVVRGLLGVSGADTFVGAVGHVHVVGDRLQGLGSAIGSPMTTSPGGRCWTG